MKLLFHAHNLGAEWEENTIPKVKSIDNDIISVKNTVFISFDIETGGEYFVVLFRCQLKHSI